MAKKLSKNEEAVLREVVAQRPKGIAKWDSLDPSMQQKLLGIGYPKGDVFVKPALVQQFNQEFKENETAQKKQAVANEKIALDDARTQDLSEAIAEAPTPQRLGEIELQLTLPENSDIRLFGKTLLDRKKKEMIAPEPKGKINTTGAGDSPLKLEQVTRSKDKKPPETPQSLLDKMLKDSRIAKVKKQVQAGLDAGIVNEKDALARLDAALNNKPEPEALPTKPKQNMLEWMGSMFKQNPQPAVTSTNQPAEKPVIPVKPEFKEQWVTTASGKKIRVVNNNA